MRLLSQGSKVSRRLRSHTRETGTEHFENGTGEERMEVVLDREKVCILYYSYTPRDVAPLSTSVS